MPRARASRCCGRSERAETGFAAGRIGSASSGWTRNNATGLISAPSAHALGSCTASGEIDTPISGAADFSGTIEVHQPSRNTQLAMTLLGPGIQAGSVDYVASGVLLTVPEPKAGLAAVVAALGLGAVARFGRRMGSLSH